MSRSLWPSAASTSPMRRSGAGCGSSACSSPAGCGRRRPRPSSQWHLDEMVVTIGGKRLWLWRAVDSEGEVLDLLVQPKRDQAAAVRLMRKLLKKQGFAPDVLVTDKLRSYADFPVNHA